MSSLLEVMPRAIVEASKRATRTRGTGEMVLTAPIIRKAAADCGYNDPISNVELGFAMVQIGAVFHSNSPTGRRYKFPGAMQTQDVLDAVNTNLAKISKGVKL